MSQPESKLSPGWHHEIRGLAKRLATHFMVAAAARRGMFRPRLARCSPQNNLPAHERHPSSKETPFSHDRGFAEANLDTFKSNYHVLLCMSAWSFKIVAQFRVVAALPSARPTAWARRLSRMPPEHHT